MSLIPNLSEIKDKKPVESGEYDLRIVKAKEDKSKNTGRYGCQLIIQIDGEDDASDIFHTLWYGNHKDFQGDDKSKSADMWRRVKDFLRALGLDPEEETSAEDLVGLEFTADLAYNDGMDTDDDGNPIKVSNPRNEIIRVT